MHLDAHLSELLFIGRLKLKSKIEETGSFSNYLAQLFAPNE